MPHPERSIFPWQCGYYPEERSDEVDGEGQRCVEGKALCSLSLIHIF